MQSLYTLMYSGRVAEVLQSVMRSGAFPDSMSTLIGLEVLTSFSSGLSAHWTTSGPDLPSWAYFDR